MKRNRPFFPIVTSTHPSKETGLDSQGFVNEVVGGLNVRDAMAMEFMSALLSNPAYVGAKQGQHGEPFTLAVLRKIAISEADSLLAMLGED